MLLTCMNGDRTGFRSEQTYSLLNIQKLKFNPYRLHISKKLLRPCHGIQLEIDQFSVGRAKWGEEAT